MFGRKRKAEDKPAKKEVKKTVKKEEVVKVEMPCGREREVPANLQGLSGRELNRALRGKTPQRIRSRGRV